MTNQSTLTFITESVPAFTVGEPQQVTLEASGGTPPYYFQITQGALPPGLNFNSDGTLAGTVAELVDGTVIFVKLTDAANASVTQAFDLQILEP